MNKRKRFIILAPSELPIPAIENGAYEQLITNIINLNEVSSKVDFLLISKANVNSDVFKKSYNYTYFYDFKSNLYLRIINKIETKFKSFFLNCTHYNYQVRQIKKIIQKLEYDKIIIVGNVEYILPVSEIVDKNKIVFYLATEILSHVNVFNKCGKIIVGNKRLINLILSHNTMIKSDDIVNLFPGIDVNYFTNHNQSKLIKLKNKIGLSEDKMVVCYVGRVVNSKGVGVLLEAALKLKHRDDFVLLIIGSLGSNFGSTNLTNSISDVEGIEELMSKLGEKCIATGFVPNDELPNYLSLADIGVVPSICEDVAPASFLQFQVIGVPTIVSDGGGIPEFASTDYSITVNRGVNMKNDLGDALEILLDDPNKRKFMGKNATRNREIYSMDRYFNDFIEIINAS